MADNQPNLVSVRRKQEKKSEKNFQESFLTQYLCNLSNPGEMHLGYGKTFLASNLYYGKGVIVQAVCLLVQYVAAFLYLFPNKKKYFSPNQSLFITVFFPNPRVFPSLSRGAKSFEINPGPTKGRISSQLLFILAHQIVEASHTIAYRMDQA